MLWQHLFWFFGHPEVYILALPFFGIVTDVIPVFSRKPLFGYRGMVFATMAIAALSTGVWAHHMFTTGVVLLPFFSLLSYLIAVPTGIKFFNWIGTMWRGQISFKTPMLFSRGLPVRLPHGWCHRRAAGLPAGGLPGPRHLLRGGPLPPGAHRDDGVRRVRRVLLLVPEDVRTDAAGGAGQGPLLAPVHRVLVDLPAPVPARARGHAPPHRRVLLHRLAALNELSTVGAFIIGFSFLFFFVNLVVSWRKPVAAGDNPWDGHALEWFTSSPPPHHNFTHLPPIRSERPTWDYNHPEARTLVHKRQGRHRRTEEGARGGRRMKVMARFLVGLGVFFGIIAVSTSSSPTSRPAWPCSSAPWARAPPRLYYLWWSHHTKPRPEDDDDADIADAAGPIESFPGSSIWPFILGMGALLAALTFVFGLWLAPIAGVLIVGAAVGGTVESRRGGTV